MVVHKEIAKNSFGTFCGRINCPGAFPRGVHKSRFGLSAQGGLKSGGGLRRRDVWMFTGRGGPLRHHANRRPTLWQRSFDLFADQFISLRWAPRCRPALCRKALLANFERSWPLLCFTQRWTMLCSSWSRWVTALFTIWLQTVMERSTITATGIIHGVYFIRPCSWLKPEWFCFCPLSSFAPPPITPPHYSPPRFPGTKRKILEVCIKHPMHACFSNDKDGGFF